MARPPGFLFEESQDAASSSDPSVRVAFGRPPVGRVAGSYTRGAVGHASMMALETITRRVVAVADGLATVHRAGP